MKQALASILAAMLFTFGASALSLSLIHISRLIAWLCDNFDKQPQKAEMVSNVLSMCGFTESPAYPCTAKYYLNKIGVTMEEFSRSCDPKRVTPYQKLIVDQMGELAAKCEKDLL